MKAKNACVLSLIKYFEKEDGYCYFKRKDLYNLMSCCGENGLRLVIDKLEEEGYIKNETVNGYVTKIKILDPTVKCYDFMLLKELKFSQKHLLYMIMGIEKRDWYAREFVSKNLNIDRKTTGHTLSMIRTRLNIEQTITNAVEVKCDDSYLTIGCIKDDHGIRFSTNTKKKCIHCGEENERMFTFAGRNICRACIRNHVKEGSNDVAKDLYIKSKGAAKHKGREFNLTKEYIEHLLKVQDYKCAYSKMNFNYDAKNYIPSVDRIDSSKGYIIGNVAIVCHIVNIMKSNLDINDFVNIIKNIYDNINIEKALSIQSPN